MRPASRGRSFRYGGRLGGEIRLFEAVLRGCLPAEDGRDLLDANKKRDYREYIPVFFRHLTNSG